MRVPSLLLILVAAGCQKTTVAEPVEVAPTSGADAPAEPAENGDAPSEPPARVTFALERAALPDVARLLERVSGLRVVLDASVDRFAECLTITVVSSGTITVDEAIAITRRAYAAEDVTLERSAGQLTFTRAEGSEPAACTAAPGAHAPPPTVAHAPPPPAPAVTPSGLPPAVAQGIREVSESEVLITRAAFDAALANQASLMRLARVIPHQENGRVVSVRIYGIRRTSLLGRLGFRNGDGLRRVNGYDMTSPESALEAYARLRTADELHVDLVRRGVARTQLVRIVPALP